MEEKEFINELKKIFVDKTGCGIQGNGKRPCNSCFHSLEGDFRHITWLIVLGLSEDYSDYREKLLEDIKKEVVE